MLGGDGAIEIVNLSPFILPYEYGLIATNHYLERKKVAGSDSSMDRYVTLKDSLDAAKADGHVDLSEARDILEDVGQRGTTVQSMIFGEKGDRSISHWE